MRVLQLNNRSRPRFVTGRKMSRTLVSEAKDDLWIFVFIILLLMAGLIDNGLINEELIWQGFAFVAKFSGLLK